MECVAEMGAEYGLLLNWSKVEALPMRMTANLYDKDGNLITEKNRMVYLGSLLSSDGKIMPELGRRLGMAAKDFQTLHTIWSHSILSTSKKSTLFSGMSCDKINVRIGNRRTK